MLDLFQRRRVFDPDLGHVPNSPDGVATHFALFLHGHVQPGEDQQVRQVLLIRYFEARLDLLIK